MKNRHLIRKPVVVLAAVVTIFSCAGATHQERAGGTGAAVGAGVGAVLGQVIGNDARSTVLGAGIGAIAGGIAGSQIGAAMDRQEADLRKAVAASKAETDRRIEANRIESDRRIKAAEARTETAVIERTQEVLTATFRSEVLFDFDAAELKPGARPELARVAEVLKRYPRTTIRVEGHSDSRGSAEYNRKLSERRAEAVRNALIEEGVDPARIEAVGYGESRPVSSSHDMNRRVAIVITPISQG